MVDEGIKVIEYLEESIGEGITVIMFVEMISMLIFYFFVRYMIFLKMENINLFKKPKNKKDALKKSYIFGHITIELIISFPIAYLLMILRGSTDGNYIWNMIISPAIGLIAAIFIDLRYIMNAEYGTPCDLSIKSFASALKTDKDSGSKSSGSYGPSNNLAPSINIQVNTGDGNVESNNGKADIKGAPPGTALAGPIEPIEHLDTKLADADNFNEKIIDAINGMKDVQSKHQVDIINIATTCNEVQSTLNNIQEAEMKKYGITLKKKMYNCLSKGFITPQEYEEIEIEYENYIKLLKGNGQIKKLYELRYSKLPMHEDRRVNDVNVENDRRSNTPLCSYGEYDDECIDLSTAH